MLVQAHLATLPRKKGERFLAELAAIIETEERIRLLLPTRPAAQRRAQARSQDEAAAWLRQILPELLRSLQR